MVQPGIISQDTIRNSSHSDEIFESRADRHGRNNAIKSSDGKMEEKGHSCSGKGGFAHHHELCGPLFIHQSASYVSSSFIAKMDNYFRNLGFKAELEENRAGRPELIILTQ